MANADPTSVISTLDKKLSKFVTPPPCVDSFISASVTKTQIPSHKEGLLHSHVHFSFQLR